MTQRLNKTETNAKRVCEYIAESTDTNAEWRFGIVWKKSRMWGYTPVITWGGEVVARASGYGYDKRSAVLVEFLQFLPGLNQITRNGYTFTALCNASGAGEDAVMQLLDESGWTLTRIYTGEREDGYSIARKATA